MRPVGCKPRYLSSSFFSKRGLRRLCGFEASSRWVWGSFLCIGSGIRMKRFNKYRYRSSWKMERIHFSLERRLFRAEFRRLLIGLDKRSSFLRAFGRTTLLFQKLRQLGACVRQSVLGDPGVYLISDLVSSFIYCWHKELRVFHTRANSRNPRPLSYACPLCLECLDAPRLIKMLRGHNWRIWKSISFSMALAALAIPLALQREVSTYFSNLVWPFSGTFTFLGLFPFLMTSITLLTIFYHMVCLMVEANLPSNCQSSNPMLMGTWFPWHRRECIGIHKHTAFTD